MDEGAYLGKGKYGDECEELLKKLDAKAVCIVVYGGSKGSGMSISSPYYEISALQEAMRDLPDMLEAIARQIRKRREEQVQKSLDALNQPSPTDLPPQEWKKIMEGE